MLHVVAQELAESERLQTFADELSEAHKGLAVEAADRKGPRARVSEPALPLLLAALHLQLERGLVVVRPEDSDARDAPEGGAWFLGATLKRGPSPVLSRAVKDSAILSAIDNVFPRPPAIR